MASSFLLNSQAFAKNCELPHEQITNECAPDADSKLSAIQKSPQVRLQALIDKYKENSELASAIVSESEKQN